MTDVVEGTITDMTAVKVTNAAAGAHGPGGLPEVQIPNAARQVKVTDVEPLEPTPYAIVVPNTPPTFYLSSRDYAGEWARVRSCWLERRLPGPYHDQYAMIRVDPPASGTGSEHSQLRTHVIIAPHSEGTTLFPISEHPLPVYVYELRVPVSAIVSSLEASDVENGGLVRGI